MKRHIVLVGLPGSGKSTVGQLVAQTLGAPFTDVDSAIVRRLQMPVARVFAELGEPRFRQAEQEVVASTLAGEPSVISPGGGWAAQPGQLDSAKASGFVIYLRCIPGTATRRSALGEVRPLLGGTDRSAAMQKLLQERAPFYAQADAVVDVDIRPLPHVAEQVCTIARQQAGW